MYLDYFHFDKHPFQIAPDDTFLYQSQQHIKALVYMDYAIWDPAGFVVITGDVGAGKTTLVKRLLRNLDQSQYCFNLSYTFLDKGELFRILLKQIDADHKVDNRIDMLYRLHDFLIEKCHEDIPVILIIDEAQYLTAENLEDIRLLAGIEGKEGPLLRVILVGQPELYQNVAQVPQLYQRVKLHFKLQSLTEVETLEYINYRLQVAGMKKNTLFDQRLLNAIYRHTKGIPRLINKTCDALLMCAFADNKHHAAITDLELILQEIMVSENMPEQTTAATKKSVQGEDNTDLAKVLLRGVKALENIDKKLNFLVTTEMNKNNEPFIQYKSRIKHERLRP